jgi:hypothetical protein
VYGDTLCNVVLLLVCFPALNIILTFFFFTVPWQWHLECLVINYLFIYSFWICQHFLLPNCCMLYQVKTDGKVIVLPVQEQNYRDRECIYIMMLMQIADS